MNGPSSILPALLCIDVEPDERVPDAFAGGSWSGFEASCDLIDRLRPRLEGATGRPVRFSWFVRMDPQIELLYGAADWAVRRYRAVFDRLREAGDEIGLHVHCWRWDEEERSWVVALDDPEWVERCLRASMAAFEEAFGRRCRSLRFGDHFLSDRVVELLDEMGVGFDLTLEPGHPAVLAGAAGERAAGALPDCSRAPRAPYRPSRADYRRRGLLARRKLWMIPITTGVAAGGDSSRLAPLRRRLAAIGDLARGQPAGRLRIDPDPIFVARRGEMGAAAISWTSRGVTDVEVRVSGPDGDLLARGGAAGEARTADWVRDGLSFYLVDVSAGVSPPPILDVLRARVVETAGEGSGREYWRSRLERGCERIAGSIGIGRPWLDVKTLNLGLDAAAIAPILDGVLASSRSTHLAMVARSDAAARPEQRRQLEATLDRLLTHRDVSRLAFETPPAVIDFANARR